MRKIFSGVGIFIMSAFLILALTICPKIFSPTEKTDTSTSYSIETTSVKTVYESFLDAKSELDTKIDNIESEINEYIANNADFKQNLIDIFDSVSSLRQAFHTNVVDVVNGDVSGTEECFSALNSLRDEVDTLYSTFNSYVSGSTSPFVLVNEDLSYNLGDEILSFKRTIETTGNSTIEYYQNLDATITEFSYVSNIESMLAQVKNLSYSNVELNSIVSNYFNLKVDEKNDLRDELSSLYSTSLSDETQNLSAQNISTAVSDASKYLSFSNNLLNILKSKFLLAITANFSDDEIANYVGFENFNSYYYEELSTKNLYLINNGIVDSDISNVFSFNVSSGDTTNAFDYMFFAMEVISFLIIAFTVILGAGMIAKEYSEGTIKLLAIRPFNRGKIMMSKIMATMFIAFLFTVISAIVAFITGAIIYGFPLSSVLVVVNATTAFVTPAWVLFLIYLGLLLVKVWLYALIAIAISTIFKSYVLAVALSAGLYLVNLIISYVAKGAVWLKYILFSHFDLFKYFGGSFIKSTTQSNITTLFTSSVFAGTNIWVSLIVVGATALILNILIFTVFRHRDLA